MTVATCNSAGSMIPVLETYPLLTTTVTSTGVDPQTITVETFTARAPMIQINWRAADLTATPTAAPSTSTTTPAGTKPTDNESPGGTMSAGSIGGIVVGCVVALVAMCALFFFLGRRRQGKQSAEARQHDEDGLRTPPPLQALHQDCGSFGPNEMEQPRKPLEMAGTRCFAELEATTFEGGVVSQR